MATETRTSETKSTALRDIAQTIGVLHEAFKTPEDQRVSNLRLFLRCIGHTVLGTEIAEDEDSDLDPESLLPPVNPYELAKTAAKAAISGKERRAMLERFKDELPDGGLVLAAFGLIPDGLRQGMSKDKAFKYFATGYPGELLDPEVRGRIMSDN